ncbi:MAG: ribose-phosphate diphosphokinase [Alphaproteobacteria bacterium]|nr:ribose-phosphate diphosphokinase [Alphaproteobacteria bacterium]
MAAAKKPILLIGNSISPETLNGLTADDRFEVITASIGKFGSGEPFAELMRGQEDAFAENLEKLKGRKVYILQSTAEPVADNTQHLLLMAHTLKQYGAGEVTAIMPFAAFMRQDRAFENRFTSIAADLFAHQLKSAGVDAVITLTPHSRGAIALYENVFGKDFTALATTGLFAADIKKRFGADAATLSVGAPDGADKQQDEGQMRARELAKSVFGAADDEHMFRIAKTHTGVSDTKITSFDGDVKGKHCVIIDDMIDGGSTMINAANLLKAQGAASVSCYATHGILSGKALERLLSAKHDGMNASIDRLALADTIPETQNKLDALLESQPALGGRVDILSAGALIAAEIDRRQKPAPAAQPAKRRQHRAP